MLFILTISPNYLFGLQEFSGFFFFSFFLLFPSLPFSFSFLSFPLLFSPLLFFLFFFVCSRSLHQQDECSLPKAQLTPVSEDFPQLNRSKPIWEVIHSHPESTHQHFPGQPSVNNWLKWGYINLARLPHGGEWLCFSSCSRASCGVRRKAVLRAKPHLSWLALLPHPASLSPLLLRALPSIHHFHQVSSSGSFS